MENPTQSRFMFKYLPKTHKFILKVTDDDLMVMKKCKAEVSWCFNVGIGVDIKICCIGWSCIYELDCEKGSGSWGEKIALGKEEE